MFETAVLSSGPQTKRVWTTLMGFTGQAMLLSGLVLAPLISPQVLPKVIWTNITLAPPSPPPPPLPPDPPVVPASRVHATRVFPGFRAPAAVPPRVLPVDDLADAAPAGPFVIGAVPDGRADGVPGGIGDVLNLARVVPVFHPPAPVVRSGPAAPAVTARPPRITVLQMAEPIQRVNPAYPALARSVRVSGKVELLGVLGTDGRIHEIKVISGHPLLIKAAVDAVMQWVYRPTILNGQAVEVQAPITVNFILN